MKDIYFNYIAFDPTRYYWSVKSRKKKLMDSTMWLSWDDEGVPARAERVTIQQTIDRAMSRGVVGKGQNPILQVMDTDNQWAMKEFYGVDRWNGCIFVDIDKLDSVLTREKMDILYNILKESFEIELWKNFYYSERSASGNYHFLFYYDVEPSEENHLMCAKYTKSEIFRIAKRIEGLTELLSKDGVFDSIYKRPYQKCFLTSIDAFVNPSCNGEVDRNKLLRFKPKPDILKMIGVVLPSKEYDVSSCKVGDIPYISHTDRWKLFCSLSRLYSGDDLRNEWIRCARMIPEGNGHNTRYYENVPYQLDWNKKVVENGSEIQKFKVDKELLRLFGYEVKEKENPNTFTYEDLLGLL